MLPKDIVGPGLHHLPSLLNSMCGMLQKEVIRVAVRMLERTEEARSIKNHDFGTRWDILVVKKAFVHRRPDKRGNIRPDRVHDA